MQVGDAGPVLDMMAVMLENMSNITVMSRTLISAVYRTGQIVATIPNLTYQNKARLHWVYHFLLSTIKCTNLPRFHLIIFLFIFWFEYLKLCRPFLRRYFISYS